MRKTQMNERILELAKQAGVIAQSETAVAPPMEKFAELIIRECADIANEQIKVAYGLDDRDGWTAAEIKKHFRVE